VRPLPTAQSEMRQAETMWQLCEGMSRTNMRLGSILLHACVVSRSRCFRYTIDDQTSYTHGSMLPTYLPTESCHFSSFHQVHGPLTWNSRQMSNVKSSNSSPLDAERRSRTSATLLKGSNISRLCFNRMASDSIQLPLSRGYQSTTAT
jgi:hypothetical protein